MPQSAPPGSPQNLQVATRGQFSVVEPAPTFGASNFDYSNSILVQSTTTEIENATSGWSQLGYGANRYALSEAFLAAANSLPQLPVTAGLSSAALRNLMLRFQSLGDNCEFGLVQRRAGAEPLDFFRFAGFYIEASKLLQQTIRALSDGFADLGDPASIVCEPHGNRQPREYMIREIRWKLLYHTGLHEGEVDKDALQSAQSSALDFRRRILLADMKAASRVFVWKSNVQVSEIEVRELVACLRRYGPNLLLWVCAEDAEHPATLVEYEGNGLLKGYVRRFAPYATAEDIEFESWYSMCRNAGFAADRLHQLGHWSRT